jgi:colanic acid biosynthesis glycosyl transferase WcaI
LLRYKTTSDWQWRQPASSAEGVASSRPAGAAPGRASWTRPRATKRAALGRPRVLFLNRSYWPDVEATGQLLTELCETLAARFEVSVVAGQPNANPDRSNFRSRGRAARHGVDIHRVTHFRFSKRNLWGRAFNLVSYLLTATARSMVLPRPDVIVAETDPPLTCLLGLLLRRRHGCPLVLYLQDIYPDVAVAVGKLPDGYLLRWVRRLLYATYRKADLVVVLSQDMKQRMLEVGVSPARLVCVPNWVDSRKMRPVKQGNRFRRRHRLDHQFVVMYSGNVGLTQRLETVVSAAALLQDRTDITFVFVGDGASRHRLMAKARRRGLSNVQFHDYQPKDELAHSLSAADVHLIPLDDPLVPCLMPSKLYGILASGTPIVAMAPRQCELASIVQQHGVGTVTPPRDHVTLAETLREYADSPARLSRMGQAARELAVRDYDRAASTSNFANLLDGQCPRLEDWHE